jgi:hypothetical protein
MNKLEYFTKCDGVPLRAYRKPSICSIIINDFIKSGIEAAKLNLKNIPLKAPSTGLRDYVRDNKIFNIKIIQRGSDVYLLNTNVEYVDLEETNTE